jgi:hypothetical protein
MDRYPLPVRTVPSCKNTWRFVQPYGELSKARATVVTVPIEPQSNGLSMFPAPDLSKFIYEPLSCGKATQSPLRGSKTQERHFFLRRV